MRDRDLTRKEAKRILAETWDWNYAYDYDSKKRKFMEAIQVFACSPEYLTKNELW